MRRADFQAFSELLSGVLAFYRQDTSRFALSVWWEACKGFDFEQVSKAFNAHAIDAERDEGVARIFKDHARAPLLPHQLRQQRTHNLQ